MLGRLLTWIIVGSIFVAILYAIFMFFVVPLLVKLNNWYNTQLSIYIYWKQRRFAKKRSFKKKYCFTYSNEATIAARRLIRGYFQLFYDHSEIYNPFDYIISTDAKIRSNKLIIRVITDNAELFMGTRGQTWDALISHIISSDWYKYEKLSGMKLRVFESSYWPLSFEEEDYKDLRL